MEKVFGIDVSKWQGNFNFAKAKKEGVEFAILRGAYSNSTSKGKDYKFEKYYSDCKKIGIPVGCYYYSTASTYNNGRKEAEYLYNNCLKDKQFEYPIYIDVEDRLQSKAGKKATTEAIKGFCEYLEPKGFYVGIYANSNFFKNYIDTKQVERYDKWIANWGMVKPNTPEGGMWQFGGETNVLRSNKIAGVTCDQDYAYKDYPTIMKQKGINGYKKELEDSTSNTSNSSSSTSNSAQTNSTGINASYYPKSSYTGNSIVDALKQLKIDSSFSYRAKIAEKNGIVNYRGTSAQNTLMLNLLKEGKLKKA